MNVNDEHETLRELERWKRVATYLADCHAATAEGVLGRKRSSQSDRKRHISICESALRYLSGGDPGMLCRSPEPVMQRLRRSAVGKSGDHPVKP